MLRYCNVEVLLIVGWVSDAQGTEIIVATKVEASVSRDSHIASFNFLLGST